jgi:molecular chaperone DnaK
LEFGIDPVTVVARGAAIFASIHELRGGGDPPPGTWRVQIEHEPIGNVPDPDIGGRVIPTRNQSLKGYTVEFVDIKTRWRSGRITLGADGIFITQLFAEEARRCEYNIELYDPTGNRIKTSPEQVAYTIGVKPANQPAPNSIGIELSNGDYAKYIEKGSALPTRGTLDHHTTVGLRAGNAEDVVRIPVIEGENSRASRNNPIGTLLIRGTDVRRDVPIGSPVDVTLIMDEYLKVTVRAFFQQIDEDFQTVFDLKMQHGSIGQMREEFAQQKSRLTSARDTAEKGSVSKALEALARITREGLVEQIDSSITNAEHSPDALPELDKKLRNLKTAIDQVEDALEWPLLLKEAEEHRDIAKQLVNNHGDTGEKNRFNTIEADLQRAIASGEPDLLRQSTDACKGLWGPIYRRLPGAAVRAFEWLREQVGLMRDQSQARQLIAQGERSIANGDTFALEAVNSQLRALLPRGETGGPRLDGSGLQ